MTEEAVIILIWGPFILALWGGAVAFVVIGGVHLYRFVTDTFVDEDDDG